MTTEVRLAEENFRASLSTLPDGASALYFTDREERPRASLGVDGSPAIVFFGEDGRVSWRTSGAPGRGSRSR